MTKPVEKIVIDDRSYVRFVRYPKQVRDGTVRCITCGQIDEIEYHVDEDCLAALAAGESA